MSLLFRIYRGRKVSSYFAPRLTLTDRRGLCEGQFYAIAPYLAKGRPSWDGHILNDDPDLGFACISRRTVKTHTHSMETAA